MSVFFEKVEKSIGLPKVSLTLIFPLRSCRKIGASVASITNVPPMYWIRETFALGVVECCTTALGKVGEERGASAPAVVLRVQNMPGFEPHPVAGAMALPVVLSICVTGE